MGFSANNNISDKNVNILYIYNEGRAKRLSSKKSFPKDFFYFFDFVKNNFQNTSYIEMDSSNKNIFSKVMNIFERLLRKITKLPFYFSQIATLRNIKKIFKSDVIILTNETVGFSTLLLFLLLKLIKKETKLIIFIMGFFNNLVNKNQNSKIVSFFLYKFLKVFDYFVFLGKGEYKYACENFTNYSKKFVFIPFSIDLEFWKANNSSSYKENILFIGNDQNRDFKLLTRIATSLPNLKFIFITNIKNDNLPNNVTLIKGSWREELISDTELRDIYLNSWLTILPLKESLQPSGQSVALQSISMKVPVMITLTDGFWDEKIFEDEKSIYFIKGGYDEWVSKIQDLKKNNSRMDVIDKGYDVVKNNYNISENYKAFNNLIKQALEI